VGFPHNIFNRFKRANLRRHSSHAFHHLLSKWNPRKLSAKSPASFSYLTLACRADLLMTQLSLYSLARHSAALPRLVVAHDETLSEPAVRKALAFWPASFECLSREAVALYWESIDGGLLARFCRKHIFGYKLAACLKCCRERRVLYADADVLWFRDASGLMRECVSLPLYATTDIYDSYNHGLLDTLPAPLASSLRERPYVNAGVAIYNRDLPEIALFRSYVSAALAEDPVHRFSEQGLVAALAKQMGGVIPNNVVCMDHEDRFVFRSSFGGQSWYARHYISRPDLRSQFWIDAYWVRNSSLSVKTDAIAEATPLAQI
jgi:hypothetical protein